jgi:hypothetical protein
MGVWPEGVDGVEQRAGSQVLKDVAGWVLLSCGVLAFLFAQLFLVGAAHVALSGFPSYWWVALGVLLTIIAFSVFTIAIGVRAGVARRSSVGAFVKNSAFCLAGGVAEVVLAVLLYGLVVIVLSGGLHSIPTVHVR